MTVTSERVGGEKQDWQQMWLNIRCKDVEDHVARTRARVVELLVEGRRDEAIALWEKQADLWALMLQPLRVQAERLRAKN